MEAHNAPGAMKAFPAAPVVPVQRHTIRIGRPGYKVLISSLEPSSSYFRSRNPVILQPIRDHLPLKLIILKLQLDYNQDIALCHHLNKKLKPQIRIINIYSLHVILMRQLLSKYVLSLKLSDLLFRFLTLKLINQKEDFLQIGIQKIGNLSYNSIS